MKKINKSIILITIILNTLFLVLTLLGKYDSIILVCLSLYLIVFLPVIIRRSFKIEISDCIEMQFLVFIFLAQLLGSVMHFYELIDWYDSFVHFLSGSLTGFLAIYLLNLFNKYDKKSIGFNILYMLALTLMVASFWEMFEFTADNLLGGDAQRVLETGVADTMKDMICALLGCIMIAGGYIYKELIKVKK